MTTLKGIHHQVGLPFRIGETEGGGVGRGRELRRYVVIGQIDAVIIGRGHFRLVGEPAGAGVFLEHRTGGYRHDGEGAVVVDPGAGLVRLLEAADMGGIVAIGPAIAVAAGLRGPEMGAPGHRHRRIRIARGELIGGQGARQGVHIVHRIRLLLRSFAAAGPGQQGHKGKKVAFHKCGFIRVKITILADKKKAAPREGGWP